MLISTAGKFVESAYFSNKKQCKSDIREMSSKKTFILVVLGSKAARNITATAASTF